MGCRPIRKAQEDHHLQLARDRIPNAQSSDRRGMPSKIHAAKCASHGSIAFVLQKLGIPTEIGTSWLAYYDNPIDAMAEGDSVHIMPGVDRKDYGATPRHCTRSQRDNSNGGFLQLTRGKSKSMTIERSSPQARDYRAREHTPPTACRSALNDYETTWFASVRFLGWQGASGLLFGPGSTSSKVSSTDCTQPLPSTNRSLDQSHSLTLGWSRPFRAAQRCRGTAGCATPRLPRRSTSPCTPVKTTASPAIPAKGKEIRFRI